eukprot:scaffold30364_cov48-Prasinocladus_malaysianus.AAC.1
MTVSTDHSPKPVVLDLDDTLICSFRREFTPYRLLHGLGANSRLDHYEISCGPEGEIPASTPGSVMVFIRPGLAEFLQELKQFAEVVVFTAGTEEYAAPILRRMDPTGELFDAVLFRGSTVNVDGVPNVKDLSVLERSLATAVMVDNNPLAFIRQPENGIPALPFTGSPADRQLLGVLLPFLKDLSLLDDVRPILAEKYMVEHFLQRKGRLVASQ